MISSSWITVSGGLTAIFMASQVPVEVAGHAYLMEPVSRQFWMSRSFREEDYPRFEECPSCYCSMGADDTRDRGLAKTDPTVLAEYGDGLYPLRFVHDMGDNHSNGNYKEPEGIAVRHGVCGDPRQNRGDPNKEDEDSNWYGTPNVDWPVLAEYAEGGEIEIKVVVGAHHYGHFEFLLCDASDLDDPDGVVTQTCFNGYALTRSDDGKDNSPIDPNYPGRYYTEPMCRVDETDQEKIPRARGGVVNTMRYRLPAGLTCDRCIMQMTWYTGHKCKHPGYDEFNPSSWPGSCAPKKEDWMKLDEEVCGDSMNAYPQEFLACADFAILADPSLDAVANTPDATTVTSSTGSETTTPYSQATSSTSSVDDCDELVQPYEQCGGDGYSGSTCCRDGYQCEEMTKTGVYSQCRAVDDGCADDWTQCGGSSWTGPDCCWPGARCVYEDEEYSVCERTE